MIKKILLNNQEFHLNISHLPLLIHSEEKAGGSLFTMTALADLYSRGEKVIALTGFPMAKEEFLQQTESLDKAQFFTKEKSQEFIDLISKTTDINNYVVLIKNVELISKETFDVVRDLSNLIISGDINNCVFKEELLQKTFKTRIYFSALGKQIPNLEKYLGYLISEHDTGLVSIV